MQEGFKVQRTEEEAERNINQVEDVDLAHSMASTEDKYHDGAQEILKSAEKRAEQNIRIGETSSENYKAVYEKDIPSDKEKQHELIQKWTGEIHVLGTEILSEIFKVARVEMDPSITIEKLVDSNIYDSFRKKIFRSEYINRQGNSRNNSYAQVDNLFGWTENLLGCLKLLKKDELLCSMSLGVTPDDFDYTHGIVHEYLTIGENIKYIADTFNTRKKHILSFKREN
jgi:hypothetical protein